MEDKRGVSRSNIDELHSWDIPGEQMEGETGVIQSIIDALHLRDIQREQIGRRKWCFWKYHS